MILPSFKKPTGESQRDTIIGGGGSDNAQLVDLSALSISPSGALITCYGATGNGKIGIGFSGDLNGYGYILKDGESVFIDNYNTLVLMYLNNIDTATSSASYVVTFFEQVK
jgi:hypothetical protein